MITKTRTSWNKNLTKENNEIMKNISNAHKGMKMLEETKQKIRGENNGAVKHLTGKTYEQIYGIEKAKEIIDKRRIDPRAKSATIHLKGKTYEQIYGIEKANEQRAKRKEKRANQIIPVKDTKIEKKIQNYLKLLNLDFYTHVYISEITHSYQCDISIPTQRCIIQKTIIEIDGDYWHGNPLRFPIPSELQKKKIEIDNIRTKELIEKGFRVIRLWETDINNMSLESFAQICYQRQ